MAIFDGVLVIQNTQGEECAFHRVWFIWMSSGSRKATSAEEEQRLS